MSGKTRVQLAELANRVLAISPGSSEARHNHSAILALREEVSEAEDLEFFSLCKMKFHTGRSAALLVTDEGIYVSAYAGIGAAADVKRLPRFTGSLRLTGPAGGEQVLHVDGLGLVLDADQVRYLRGLRLISDREVVTSGNLSLMPKDPGETVVSGATSVQARDSRQGTLGARLFVSHASEEESVATGLTAELQRHGVSAWLATRDIQVGENYAAQIHDAIVESSHLVVLLSPASIESVHVQREVNLALDQGKALLPVVVAEHPDFLSTLPAQWKYWLGVVQVVPYFSAANTVEALLRSIGARA